MQNRRRAPTEPPPATRALDEVRRIVLDLIDGTASEVAEVERLTLRR